MLMSEQTSRGLYPISILQLTNTESSNFRLQELAGPARAERETYSYGDIGLRLSDNFCLTYSDTIPFTSASLKIPHTPN